MITNDLQNISIPNIVIIFHDITFLHDLLKNFLIKFRYLKNIFRKKSKYTIACRMSEKIQ